MFQTLVSHNADLGRLVEKGYAVAFDTNYLVVRDIPYLDAGGVRQTGTLVAKLVFVDQDRVRQDDHQVFFAGSVPHGLDGKPIPNLGGGDRQLTLSDSCRDVVVQRSFSNKPKATGAFADFYDKIESYVAIISGPAIEKYNASPYTFRVVEQESPDSIFKFHDTLTSRAELTDLVGRFKQDVIAVIGLGGTGAYLLDFMVKTPVREIRSFDLDPFYVHNAFRSPGRTEEAEFGNPKAAVYQARYEHFRHGLSMVPNFIDSQSSSQLDGATFAFVCVDKGPAIPFIDVGMGLNRSRGALNGLLRVTYFSAADAQTVRDKQLVDLSDRPDDVYHANIQIAELNALNACLAVIRFKQLRGFYLEEAPLYNLLFGIGDVKIVSESELA
jgi:hypothetical protein